MRPVTASMMTWLRMLLIITLSGALPAIVLVVQKLVVNGLDDLNGTIQSPIRNPHEFLAVWGILSCWAVCAHLSHIYTYEVANKLQDIRDDVKNQVINLKAQMSNLEGHILDRLDKTENAGQRQSKIVEGVLAQNTQLLSVTAQEVLKKKEVSPYLRPVWNESFHKIIDVASGTVEIPGTPTQIWTRYEEFFDYLSPDADFLATCVIPNEKEKMKSVFGDPSFQDYCERSYSRVLNPAANAKMKKLFMLESKAMGVLDSGEGRLLLDHLRRIDKISRDSNGRLQAKIASWNEMERKFSGEKIIDSDFMIWGTDLVVHGRMGPDRTLRGAELCIVEGTIERRREQFNRYFDCGQPLSEWLQRYGAEPAYNLESEEAPQLVPAA